MQFFTHRFSPARQLWVAAVFALGGISGLHAQDVTHYVAAKGQSFSQDGSGTPALRSDPSPYGFYSSVKMSVPGSVTNATIRTPGLVTKVMGEGVDAFSVGSLSFTESFSTLAALNAAYASGPYLFSIYTFSEQLKTPSLVLSGDAYPVTPQIANWAAAQSIDAAQDFTLNWFSFSGAGAEDFIQLTLEDISGQGIFSTPDLGEPDALSGSATSTVIPAGFLIPGQTYKARLLFVNFTSVNTAAYPGAVGHSGYYKQTQTTILTLNPAGILRFSSDKFSARENTGLATITVSRVGGSIGEVSVGYSTWAGSAVVGTDYPSNVFGSLDFADGQNSATFTIPIVNDFSPEVTKTLYCSLLSPAGGATLGVPNLATLSILDDESPAGPNVVSYLAAKGQTFTQTDTNPPASLPGELPFHFFSMVKPSFPGSVASATLRLPNATTRTLTNFTDEFSFGNSFSNKTLLDSGFGSGAYLFTIQTLNDGTIAPSLTLPADSYPNTPRLANWLATQDLDPKSNFPLTWDPLIGGTSNDFIQVSIRDEMGQEVTGSPDFLEDNALTGTATAWTIAADKLTYAKIYQARVLFFKRASLNTNSYPKVPGVTGFFKETTVTLATTIIPPPEGALQFTTAAFSANENGGAATITIARTGGSTGEVSAAFATGTGSALANIDYVPINGTVTFAEGETSKSFTVVLLDDFNLDGTKMLNLTLRTPIGGAILRSPTNAVLTILDNELTAAGKIEFSATNYTVGENLGNASILVMRTGGLASGVTVDLLLSNLSTSDEDYTNVSRTLSFAANETSKTILVPIRNDSMDEVNETLLLSLSNPTGGASLGSRTNATLTLTDDDAGGTLQFSLATYSVSETGRLATITVTRSGGAASGVSVDFTTLDGSARADSSDYFPTNGTLFFASNILSQSFTVPVLDDNLPEGNETLLLRLSNPMGGATLGTLSNATLTIVDNEVTLQFSSATYTNNEGAGFVTLTLARTGPVTGTVSVDYFTKDGSATSNQDYQSKSAQLTLPPGVTSLAFTLSLTNDTLVEGTESFEVCLTNPGGGAQLGSRTNATVFILDNDLGGTIGFSSPTYSVTEGSPTALVTIIRTGGAASGVIMELILEGLTATPDEDYTVTFKAVSFAANEASKTIAIPIINDPIHENSEMIKLTLANVSGGATLGTNNVAVLTIGDNDLGGTIQFSAPTYSVNESNLTVTIRVNRTGGGASGVTVDYTTSSGSAAADFDYVTTYGTLTFGSNEMTKTFTIPIYDDTEDETNETVILTLSNPTGGATLGNPRTATLTIVDDDVNVEGTYSMTGSLSQTGCSDPSDNASTPFNGEMVLMNQNGRNYSGSAILINTASGGGYGTLTIYGVVDSAGRLTGAYFGDRSYGNFTGTLSGKRIQLSFGGYETGDTCVHNGSMSGDNAASKTSGFALPDMSGASAILNVTSGTGIFAPYGSVLFSAFSGNNYQSTALSGPLTDGYGVYVYNKTGPNTATLTSRNIAVGLTGITTMIFNSPTTGTYSITAVGYPGNGAGNFTIQP